MKLRQVTRIIHDGNTEIKVVVLQVWRPLFGDPSGKAGRWEDIPIVRKDW